MNSIFLNCNSKVLLSIESEPVERAVKALYRDIDNTCLKSNEKGVAIKLCPLLEKELPSECFRLKIVEGCEEPCLLLEACDDLGFIYGIYHISREILGVKNFWFWNQQKFIPKDKYEIEKDYHYESKPYGVRFRGWFVNDEVLFDTWTIDGDNDRPFEMAFEALLRCGGNMTIPGTDANAHIYNHLASKMGLWITHHHAEPLGAKMFSREYPDLDPSYDKYPELFMGLWKDAINAQKGMKVLWNLGFRGQGDRPFWSDDPAYDTDEKRGKLISSLIKKQYDLIKSVDNNAVCCSNLYGETMELYKKGFIDIPDDVIFIWADNGFGKMVSRRQGNHNPRVEALPAKNAGGRHGIYYHASFYDLQAAAQMTMLPNSPLFVAEELKKVKDYKATDYWIINCSNVRPHAYILDLISEIWRGDKSELELSEKPDFSGFVERHRDRYIDGYYSAVKDKEALLKIKELYKLFPEYAPKYGPNEDDHAGEQFALHGGRVLATAFVTGFNKDKPHLSKAAAEWLWFSDNEFLIEQVRDYKLVVEKAVNGYSVYLDKCRIVLDTLDKDNRILLEDTFSWQVEYLYYSYLGTLHILKAIEDAIGADAEDIEDKEDKEEPDVIDCISAGRTETDNFLRAFYEAGCACKAYKEGYELMRSHEHGDFEGFFYNDCEADIRQSYHVAGGLMSFLRFCGDGPHFYKWQRQFQQGAGGDKVHLILRIKRHITDEELFELLQNNKKA